MNKWKCIALSVFTIVNIYSQNIADSIKTKAIECNDLVIPNERLYSFLKNYKCICLGEMHGAKEPAEFLVYLTKLFTDKGRKVIIGIEISENAMMPSLKNPIVFL